MKNKYLDKNNLQSVIPQMIKNRNWIVMKYVMFTNMNNTNCNMALCQTKKDYKF